MRVRFTFETKGPARKRGAAGSAATVCAVALAALLPLGAWATPATERAGLKTGPYAGEHDQREEVRREFSKNVAWKAGQRVCARHSFGSLTVTAHTAHETRLRVDMKASASNRADAEEFINQIEIRVEENSTGVCFRTEYPEHLMNRRRGNFSFSVEYNLTVPEAAPLDLRNNFGSVAVRGMAGGAQVVNGHGAVTLEDTRGAQRVENSFGAITVTGNAGDVDLTGANGNIAATRVEGALTIRNRFGRTTALRVSRNLSIRNSNGEVRVETVGGAANIVNSFGGTEVLDVAGLADVQNSNGRITARDLKGGAALKSSFGNVDAENITGNADISASNGRLQVADVTGEVTLSASFGSIEASDIGKGARVTGGNGSITLSDIGGDTFVKTSFGQVRATDINGALTVENSNGGIFAGDVTGAASVRTSFGGVQLEGIGGAVDVQNNNGSVTVALTGGDGRTCRRVALRTGFSPLRIYLPENANYDVHASTSFGRINSDFPLTLTPGTQLGGGGVSSVAIDSKIGAGGCELRLVNQNGGIEIRNLSSYSARPRTPPRRPRDRRPA